MFSFRMIGDTRIECQDANSLRENTQGKAVSSLRTGAEPGGSASAEPPIPPSITVSVMMSDHLVAEAAPTLASASNARMS